MKKILLLLSHLFIFSGTTICMEVSPDIYEKQEVTTENRDPYIFEIPLWESPQSWDFLEQPVSTLLKFSGNPEDRHTYLWQLQILANLLLVSSEFEQFLRNSLLPVTEDISKVPVTKLYEGFHFYYEAEGINTIKISTTEGKAVVSQLLPLTYKYDHLNLFPAYNDFFDTLLHNDNEEVVIAAHHIKNSLLQNKRAALIGNFTLFGPVLIMHFYQPSQDWEFAKNQARKLSINNCNYYCELIANEQIAPIVQKMLENNNCSYIESYIPHVIWIYRFLNVIFNTLRLAQDEVYRKFTCTEDNTFQHHLQITLKNLSATNKRYEQLYKKILAEQNIIIRSLPQSQRINALKEYKLILFNPTTLNQVSARSLPNTLSCTKFNRENEDSFLPKTIVKKQQQQPIHKKKKSRNRYHKKQSHMDGEEKTQSTSVPKKNVPTFTMTTKSMDLQETRIIPKYDKRVIARLRNFQTNDLYHTFNPLADLFIFHYGIQEKRANATHSDRKDTVYYMAGEIYFKEIELTQTVLFACSKDKNGICYHRGFEKKQDSLLKELRTRQFNFDFAETDQETSNVTLEEKDMHLKVPLYPDATYKENSFYIVINDPSNDVQITLFKPQIACEA